MSKRMYKPGKRGAIIFENELGTLEASSVRNGKGTFIGSCIINGVEHTRRMSGDKYETKSRWENWQRTVIETEKLKEARAMAQAQMTDTKLLEAIKAIASELKGINSTLSEIGIAIMEDRPMVVTEPVEDGVDEFIKDNDWTDFINLTTKQVYGIYTATKPKVLANQRTITDAVKDAFADNLDLIAKGDGYKFAAKKKGKK